MNYDTNIFAGTATRAESTNKVLRNTYQLLSMTLLLSAVMAWVGMQLHVNPHPIIVLIGAIGLLFGVQKTADSSAGLILTFLFTGWMGFWLAPLLNAVMARSGGGQIIMQALGGTGLIFLSLSGYVLTSKKDFSFMRGFLFVGLMVVVLASLGMLIASMFGVYITWMSLALSAASVLLFSGFILYDTSNIINGGETNYIRATIQLYLDILNIFVSLLNILGIMRDE